MTAMKAVTSSMAKRPDNMIVLANMRGLVQQQVRGRQVLLLYRSVLLLYRSVLL